MNAIHPITSNAFDFKETSSQLVHFTSIPTVNGISFNESKASIVRIVKCFYDFQQRNFISIPAL